MPKRGRDEPTHYQTMGLDSPSVTLEQIQRQYKKLALAFHPDRVSSRPPLEQTIAKQTFQKITEAYGILSDREKRLDYDTKLGINFSGRVAALAKTAQQRTDVTQHARGKDTSSSTRAVGGADEEEVSDDGSDYEPPSFTAPPTDRSAPLSGVRNRSSDDDDNNDDDDHGPDQRQQPLGPVSGRAPFGVGGGDLRGQRPSFALAPAARQVVKFMVTRTDPATSLGIKIKREGLYLLDIVPNSPAARDGFLPNAAELAHMQKLRPFVVGVSGTPVTTFEDFVRETQGKLTVIVEVSCFIMEAAIPKSSFLSYFDHNRKGYDSRTAQWSIDAGTKRLHRDPVAGATAEEVSIIGKRVLRCTEGMSINPLSVFGGVLEHASVFIAVMC